MPEPSQARACGRAIHISILLCGRAAGHTRKPPGQIAYQAAQKMIPSILWLTWDDAADGVREAFEAAARAVLAAQHYDDTDGIMWSEGEGPGE